MLCISTFLYYYAFQHFTKYLILLGISFYRASLTRHFILLSIGHTSSYHTYCPTKRISSYKTHLILLWILSFLPHISLFYFFKCTLSYCTCHPTVRVILPSACHFAESTLIAHQVQNTTLYISLYYNVFYPIVYLTLLLILV